MNSDVTPHRLLTKAARAQWTRLVRAADDLQFVLTTQW
jgi:hypothetical protein